MAYRVLLLTKPGAGPKVYRNANHNLDRAFTRRAEDAWSYATYDEAKRHGNDDTTLYHCYFNSYRIEEVS